MTIDVDLLLGTQPAFAGFPARDISINISKAPHILVAGMTGSGKSVLVHDLIIQFVRGRSAADVGLVLIDPKRCEFGIYRNLPHLQIQPVYDDDDIVAALHWVVSEMNSRFTIMERNGVRDVSGTKWARMLVVVDELANLMLKGSRFEAPLIQIASMGRAAGIHLLLATQRPDASVINGLIRANVPTRVALATFTAADSRIILDAKGAEDLGMGQRLVRLPGEREPKRVNGRLIQDREIDAVIAAARLGHAF